MKGMLHMKCFTHVLVSVLACALGVTAAEVSTIRSEEHTSELQSHGLISYAVFCLV